MKHIYNGSDGSRLQRNDGPCIQKASTHASRNLAKKGTYSRNLFFNGILQRMAVGDIQRCGSDASFDIIPSRCGFKGRNDANVRRFCSSLRDLFLTGATFRTPPKLNH